MSSETAVPGLRDYTNNQHLLDSFGAAPSQGITAATTLANSSYGQVDQLASLGQGLLDSYSLFPNTPHIDPIDTQPVKPSRTVSGTHPPAKPPLRSGAPFNPRPVPYNLASRCADRSNDNPLTIISEQDSRSTLDVRGSPWRGTNPVLQLRDKKAHHSMSSQGGRSEQRRFLQPASKNAGDNSVADISMDNELNSDAHRSVSGADVATVVQHSEHLKSMLLPPPASQADKEENKGRRSFVQTIMQAVRDAPRRFLMTNSPYIEVHQRRSVRAEKEWSRFQQDQEAIAPEQKKEGHAQIGSASNGPCQASPPQREPHQAGGQHTRRISDASRETSAHFQLPSRILHLPPGPDRPADGLILRAPRTLLPSSQVPSQSTHPPLSQDGNNRRVASDHVVSTTPTLPTRGRTDSATRYTFDGVPLFRNDAHSLHEYDSARDVDTSLCSTTSTSYSGTVLGVDLDLQLDFPPRRSPTPTWLTLPETDHSEPRVPPQGIHKQPPQTTVPRSITSSALPILLPLAAASGIVRPNHATPQLSFFSPSGNLIQADEHYVPPPPPSSSSYHNTNTTAARAPEPLARPVRLPATTTPPPSIPLPVHLQRPQHHHHAHSRIVPQTVTPSSVRGCHGIVRSHSLQPRSGVRRPSPSNEHSRSSVRERGMHTASRSSFAPSLRSRDCTARSSGPPVKWRRRGRAAIGPLAGWTLRVCFCQPLDGAGEAETACLRPEQRGGARPGSRVENVRVVDKSGVRRGELGKRKVSDRQDSGVAVV